MKKMMPKLVAGALILGLNPVLAAHAAVTFNGPDLNGTRVGLVSFWGDKGNDSCLPSSGCPTNGPDLTGTRVGIVSFWGDEGGSETYLGSILNSVYLFWPMQVSDTVTH